MIKSIVLVILSFTLTFAQTTKVTSVPFTPEQLKVLDSAQATYDVAISIWRQANLVFEKSHDTVVLDKAHADFEDARNKYHSALLPIMPSSVLGGCVGGKRTFVRYQRDIINKLLLKLEGLEPCTLPSK